MFYIIRKFYTIIFVCVFSILHGQEKNPYLYPILPGKPSSLAGTLGELRSNHFHSGIDIRTNNMTGYAVYASADGYISRAAMSASGYGNVLYVTHPDGYTTVYAHLERFKGKLADYVKRKQYEQKTFEIDLYFLKHQFPVKQGDTIAFSGNTGSSAGPHLHFEIRDKNNNPIDPLSFRFSEITDTFAPYTEKLALQTRTTNARINNQFGRFEFYALKNNNDFIIPYPISAEGLVGIEIIAKDKLAHKSSLFGGVNFIEVWANDTLLFKQEIHQLNFSDSRKINTLMNYPALRNNKNKFYKLYLDDGNSLPFYKNSPHSTRGVYVVEKEKKMKIVTRDLFGNTSTLSFLLMPASKSKSKYVDTAIKKDMIADVIDNTLLLRVNSPLDSLTTATAYCGGVAEKIAPSYGGDYTCTYLIDLQKQLPDSITTIRGKYTSHLKAKIPSGSEYIFVSPTTTVFFPKDALYDTLYFTSKNHISSDSSEILTVGDPDIPLHKNISITWTPSVLHKWTPQSAIYRMQGNSLFYIGGTYTDGQIQFNTREFGSFTISRDSIPPTIKMTSISKLTARFVIKDNLSGIDKYEATIDGKWLLMHYDSKSGNLTSERLNDTQPLRGNLTLTVTDKMGNKSNFSYQIP